jgi:hypothetical protein
MLTRHARTLTETERKSLAARLPLLALRARREVRRGEVEVLTFEVERVWPLISCLGRGCCPCTWLIDTGDEYVYFFSWDLLAFAGFDFPGRRVVIERLPRFQRIVGAVAAGDPVPVLPHIEREWEVFERPPRGDCAVLPRASVRAERLPQS